MDNNTRKELLKVGASIPKSLSSKLIKEEVDTSEEELARFAIRKGDLSHAKKEELAKLIDKGAFRRSEKIIDEKVAAEIDKINEEKVRQLRASGRIKDPKNDAWYQERLYKMRKR